MSNIPEKVGEKKEKKLSKKELAAMRLAEEEAGLSPEERALRAEQRKRAARKKRKKNIKTAIIVLAVLLVVAFLVLRFVSGRIEEASKPYNTYTVGRRDVTLVLSGTGSVQPVKTYTVSSRVTGEVVSAPIVEGADVKEGDVLYEIDSSDIQSSIRSAQNSLRNTQLSYNDVVEGYDDLHAESDYTGTVVELNVEVGDTVSANQIIGKIRDDATMYLKVPFFESDAAVIFVGEQAEVTMDDSFETVYGSVHEISAVVDTQANGTRVTNVTIAVANPGGIGMESTASARIGTLESAGAGAFEYSVDENLVAGVSGEVTYLGITEGGTITEGMTFIRVSGDNVNKSLEKAEISLSNAQISYQNTLDKLDDYTITAPISGTVVEANYNLGESVDSESGFVMATIYDMSSYTFEMNIDELDIVDVALGQEVNITCDAREGSEYLGKITKISKQGVSSSGVTSYPVTITIDDPLALEELLPGMNVDAEIVVRKVENTLAIPVDAVGRGNVIKVIKKESLSEHEVVPAGGQLQRPEGTKAPEAENAPAPDAAFPAMGNEGFYGTLSSEAEYEELRVSLGISDDDYVEVLEGLSDGDVIIVEQANYGGMSMFGISGGGMAGMGHPGGMGNMGGGMGGPPSGGMGGPPSGGMGGR